MPYPDQDDTTVKWLVIFVVVSLLAHVLFISAILLISHFMPVMKLPPPPPAPPNVTLSLMPAPVQPPPMKHPFMMTPEQPNAKPKQTLIESNHDTQVASHSKTSRQPDNVMPDVTSPHKHASDLHESPNSPSKQPQNPSPPTPKQPDQPKQPPTPPQPKQPTKADQTPPNPQPPQPNPVKTTPPKPVQPQVDPITGLPVLPPINARTMAQQTPQTATQSTQAQTAAPPPMVQATAQDLQGRAGISGQPSPEAMATDLGRYKAKFYAAVASRWYPRINDQLQLIGVGTIRIQYTIYADGTITTQVLQGGNGSLMLLQTASLASIRDVSPFDPFTPGMIKELKKLQGPGGGNSYTDDFTFSIYGN